MIRSKIQERKSELHKGEKVRNVKAFAHEGPQTPAEEGEGTWIFSYADLITILMMFFIIMLSISNVSPEKFNALKEALKTEAADQNPSKTIIKTDHDTSQSTSSNSIGDINLSRLAQQAQSTGGDKTTQILTGARILLQSLDQPSMRANLEQVKEIADVKQQLVAAQLSARQGTPFPGNGGVGDSTRIEIVFANSDLFQGSVQELKPGAQEIIRSIFEKMRSVHPMPYLEIESHLPASKQLDLRRQNESDLMMLSSRRSYQVYREFIRAGADPGLIAIAGYGNLKPLVKEVDAFGKPVQGAAEQNDRVVIRLIWRRPAEAIAQ
jgi:chemotaxis protein MotB